MGNLTKRKRKIEKFHSDLEETAKDFRQPKPKVTVRGSTVRIKIGKLFDVKAKGYDAARRKLNREARKIERA